MINLSGFFCEFSRANGKNKRVFQLKADGSIRNLKNDGHDNESFWQQDGNQLLLLSSAHQVTSTFKITKEVAHQVYLDGNHGRIPLVIIAAKNQSDLFLRKTRFFHQQDIDSGCLEVGSNTYGYLHLIDKEHGKLIIGDYCSIAADVKFILGNHRIDLVTTYPFHDLQRYFTHLEVETDDHSSKGDIEIGNDVWIGNSAQIMSGVKIGNGAIIAANAIVNKNVEPYSIVGGNPAKHIKFRIDDPVKRQQMLEIAWWNWSEELIAERINKIMSTDIDSFISEFCVERKLEIIA